MPKVLARALPVLLLVLALWAPGQVAARAHRAAEARATVTSYGVSLTLSLPAGTYPLNALVPYSLTIKNTSRRTVWLCCAGPPMRQFVFVDVGTFGRDGRPVTGPTLDIIMPLPGPGPSCIALQPKGTIHGHDYLVLAGPVVRAAVTVHPMATGPVCFHDRSVSVRTKPITLSLVPPDTPRATLDSNGGEMEALLEPPESVTGNPLYISSCADDDFATNPNDTVQKFFWTRADGPTVPGCYKPMEWHALAAWPGHSVVQIDYLKGRTSVALALAPRASAAPAPRSLHAATTAHGIKLTLIVPNRRYPANALIRVTVMEQNVSRHAIQLTSECPYGSPRAEVVYAQSVQYPPALPGAPRPHCPLPRLTQSLGPGQAIQRHPLVVLRSSLVRAVGSIALRRKSGTAYTEILGRQLSVQTVATREPDGGVVTSEPPHARFIPPPGATGPLYYQYWIRCDTAGGTTYPATYSWLTSASPDVYPADPYCPRPAEWHVIGGWLNEPVTTVKFPDPPPPIELGLTLGPPLQPPHLTLAEALKLAVADWGDVAAHPARVEYGSLDPGNSSFDGKNPGTVDVWKITVIGVSMPSPAPGNPTVYHHLAIVVDDKAGKVLYGRYY